MIEPLPEITLVVVQPDADQRHAEIGRRLDVIARQDAEAARVDRQRLVQAEFGGEVRDGPRAEDARVAPAPRVARAQILLHPPVGVVDAAVQGELRRALLEMLDGHLVEQGHGVVADLAPRHRIELAEERGRVGVPAPPQVLRQRLEPLMAGRDELAERPRFADDRPQLGAGGLQHAHVRVAERPRFGRLDDQHALEQPAIHDRHAEKRSIRILAGVGEILEPGMRRGIGDALGLEAFGDQTGQALRQAHPDAADAFLPEPDRRREHEIRPIGLQEVDGTDVGREPPLNQVDDVGERFGCVPALRDEPPDLLERPEAFVVGCRRHDRVQSKKAASSFAEIRPKPPLSARRRHSILSRRSRWPTRLLG